MQRPKQLEQVTGKFIFGWAEFKDGRRFEVKDSKGRLERVDVRPPKIVTRMLVELEDGSCVPVNGDAFETLEKHSIPIPLKTVFSEKFKALSATPDMSYKEGDLVRLKKSTFKNNGYTVYDEIE